MPINSARLPLVRAAALTLAASILLVPVASAKRPASFEMPVCERLMQGSGPNETPAPTAVTPNSEQQSTTDVKRGVGSSDLAPMKLTEDKDSFSIGNDGKIKMEVQQSVESASKGATGPDMGESASVIGDRALGQKLIKDAKAVSVAPLALVESEDEAQRKLDMLGESERAQLTDLWSATINRSPDVQFVINRLQPNSDPNHATATAVRMLSGALFSAVQAAPMLMGPGMNMGAYLGIGSGASMLQNLLQGNDAKAAKKQAISQEQATILYKIVRDTADKVVLEYRKYKKTRADFDRATTDLEDLRTMVTQARAGQDASKQVEMEYTLRKAQRDVENITDEAKIHRMALIDLSGPDAVQKLDDQVEQEKLALKKMIGPDQNINQDPLEAPPTEVAGQARPDQKVH